MRTPIEDCLSDTGITVGNGSALSGEIFGSSSSEIRNVSGLAGNTGETALGIVGGVGSGRVSSVVEGGVVGVGSGVQNGETAEGEWVDVGIDGITNSESGLDGGLGSNIDTHNGGLGGISVGGSGVVG